MEELIKDVKENWGQIKEAEERQFIHRARPKGVTYRKAFEKMGRNEPCFCGSGKKYKHCCYEKTHDIYVEVQGGNHVYGIRD